MLVSPRLRVLEDRTVVLNPHRFRRAQARWLGLDRVTELAWAKERRVCLAVRVALPDGGTALVSSLHATSLASEQRVPDAELRRAAAFLEGLAAPDEPVFLCGDTKSRPRARARWPTCASGATPRPVRTSTTSSYAGFRPTIHSSGPRSGGASTAGFCPIMHPWR